MSLFNLLTDRQGINLLKVLYDNEFSNKNSHAMSLSQAAAKLDLNLNPRSIDNLREFNLISTDQGQEELVLAITAKGKTFLEQFDQLRTALLEQPKQKAFTVEYDLTPADKKVLQTCMDMSPTTESVIAYRSGTEESIQKILSKLHSMNLITIEDEIINITDSGQRVIGE